MTFPSLVDRAGPALFPAIALVLAFAVTAAVGSAFPSPAAGPVPSAPAADDRPTIVVDATDLPARALSWAFPEADQAPPADPAEGAWQPVPQEYGVAWHPPTSLSDHAVCLQAPDGWVVSESQPADGARTPTRMRCQGPWAPELVPASVGFVVRKVSS